MPAMASVQAPQTFPTNLSGCPSELASLTFASRWQFSDRDCKPEKSPGAYSIWSLMMISDNLLFGSTLPQAESRQAGDSSADQIFTVLPNLNSETLLANASQDLASVQALAGNLAFDVDGPQRDAVLGIHRMVEGIQLMVDRVLDLQDVPISN